MGAEEFKLFLGGFCPLVLVVKSNRWTLLFVPLIFHAPEALHLERKCNQQTWLDPLLAALKNGLMVFQSKH